jgi:hypothetical protein
MKPREEAPIAQNAARARAQRFVGDATGFATREQRNK